MSKGRTFAQVSVSTWTDDDYRDLPQPAKALYVAMLSHPSLNGLGVGVWDLHEFAGFDPDTTDESVLRSRSVLTERRYVVVDDDAKRYAIRSYLRTNSHLINNPKNAKGLVNAYMTTFSKTVRHSALHELYRLKNENPSSVGWPILAELFAAAKFDFTTPPSSVVSPVGSGDASSDLSTDEDAEGSTDASPVRSPVGSISTQYSILNKEKRWVEKPTDERPELQALCEHLANTVEGNDFKRPETNATAIRAARLLLDTDGYTAEQITWMIDWVANHQFWYKNIRSMAKLREKFDRLKADVKDEAAKSANGGRAPTLPAAPRLSKVEDLEDPPEGLTDAELSAWFAADRKRRGV